MKLAAHVWAARALRSQEMPSEEICAVLRADDPAIVHRYMELHRERLEERLADRLRTLVRLEGLLVASETPIPDLVDHPSPDV